MIIYRIECKIIRKIQKQTYQKNIFIDIVTTSVLYRRLQISPDERYCSLYFQNRYMKHLLRIVKTEERNDGFPTDLIAMHSCNNYRQSLITTSFKYFFQPTTGHIITRTSECGPSESETQTGRDFEIAFSLSEFRPSLVWLVCSTAEPNQPSNTQT